MENWRAYVNEQEEEIGAAPQEPKKGVFKKLGMYIAQKFGTLDDKAKETYCSKRFPVDASLEPNHAKDAYILVSTLSQQPKSPT